MEENPEESMEIFSQDGVLLTSAPAAYMAYFSSPGTLYLVEYLNSNRMRTIEWKPNDITVDSDVQDQEWAVVNTVERRARTLSGGQPSDGSSRSKYLKVNFVDVKSFRVGSNHHKLFFMDGRGENLCTFTFTHGSCQHLVGVLKGLLPTAPSRRNKNIYVVMNDIDAIESQRLDRSFAELNLFQEPTDYVFKFVRNFHNRPYETTMEAFSKITDIVYRGPEERLMDNEVHDILNRSLEAIENTGGQGHDEYEVIAHMPKLPERKCYPRGCPLSQEQWKALQDQEGRIEDVEAVKLVIFRGGICPALRKEVWKFLLDYNNWEDTNVQRNRRMSRRADEYYVMKLQWRSMTMVQENNFSDYRDRKSLIQKDVNRTDRAMEFFAGENNSNIQSLYDILMSYVMYNFDLGYVQGMSDLLAPILYLMNNENDTFWCFVGFMNKVSCNFDMDQAGMKEQLEHLHTLIAFIEPEFATYLDRHDSGNMFFCFRWLLVWFKRELSYSDVMYMWEVIWTGLPCQNFHLLICVAILETEKNTFMENDYGFTEILKHVNDLCGHIDVAAMISKAEAIYYQITEAEHLTDAVRFILGLPLLGNNQGSNSKEDSPSTDQPSSLEAVNFNNDEVFFDRAISNSFL